MATISPSPRPPGVPAARFQPPRRLPPVNGHVVWVCPRCDTEYPGEGTCPDDDTRLRRSDD